MKKAIAGFILLEFICFLLAVYFHGWKSAFIVNLETPKLDKHHVDVVIRVTPKTSCFTLPVGNLQYFSIEGWKDATSMCVEIKDK